MLKNILNLKETQLLSKNQQRAIEGGSLSCRTNKECVLAWGDPYAICHNGRCIPG